MSNTIASLQRKIASATDLQSVVRTMKALAAASLGQFEQSVRGLADYYATVEHGLGACLRNDGTAPPHVRVEPPADSTAPGAIVFGSDQGLVGQFNDVVADHALATLRRQTAEPRVWAVGERVHARLLDAGISPCGVFNLPTSVSAISPLVGQILVQSEAQHSAGAIDSLHLFYNRPQGRALYEPVEQRLLPLDESWHRGLTAQPWPNKALPEVVGNARVTLRACISEYLFVSLFRACAESLASENASRLAAMQRAERNISDLLEDLGRAHHQQRQTGIDEELFDVVSGFEALARR